LTPDDRFYLEERYLRPRRSSRLLPLYYLLKPFIPRGVRMGARRAIAREQRERHESQGRFPRWPIEPLLVVRRERRLRERLQRSGQKRLPQIATWPGGHRFAWTLTHDVEGAAGLANVERLLDVERRHGLVSAWFLVAEDYPLDPGAIRTIREAGGEVGLHGLHHDGRLFQSRARFEAQLPSIHHYLRDWGADGFRSPSTHRNAAWMPELGAAYDSSFPDTHPFDAQPGGCCEILPYFLGDLVELPITLPQDHTLFELLREDDIGIWRRKSAWIAEHGGLVTALVHPDYALTPERLAHYDELLRFLRGLEGGWHALPRDIAGWWRRRAAFEARLEGHAMDEHGLAAGEAPLWWSSQQDGCLVIDTEDQTHA
jgi:peptidoglycan/xylan/chitin deacetylase (PgdA/CDA1 family)